MAKSRVRELSVVYVTRRGQRRHELQDAVRKDRTSVVGHQKLNMNCW